MESLYTKLLKVQEEISPIKKSSDNPFFKSKYFDINQLLETVKPVLTKNKLVLIQPLEEVNGLPAIKTVIIDSETGDSLSSIHPIPTVNDAQKMGSAITYFRRYSLQSLLGLQAEDDDGNKASGKAPAKKPAPKKKTTSSF